MNRLRSRHIYRKQRAAFKARCKQVNAPCARCHGELGPIDYDADPQTPRAFELGHKLPLATYPHLAYDEQNWAPEHSSCNRNAQTKPMQPKTANTAWVKPLW